jgi:hypothetical protein
MGSYRFTRTAARLLERPAVFHGLSKSGVMEMSIRQEARRRGLLIDAEGQPDEGRRQVGES